MKIIYAVSTCSDKVYKQLFEKVKVKPAFQSQKYHRLLIEGLAKHTEVDVVANPPVNRSVLSENFVKLPREEEGGARYRYIPAIRNPIVKMAAVGLGTFFHTLMLAEKNTAVVVDGLNGVTAMAALAAAKLRRRPCVCIVTDLPDMLGESGFHKKITNFVIGHCSHYVFLTEAMNGYCNPKGKPYVILEGHSDITMRERIPSMGKKCQPRVCLYAGGVSKQYGLQILVEGFRAADIPNARLDIYGPGDYVEELEAIAKEDNRVFYGGMLLNTQIVEKEQEATLLVNPRPTHEEFVKYSFPSKTMEYMASGTPVLTTVLPGMPKEYHPYVFLIEEETEAGVSRMLQTVLAHSDEELFQKGQKARTFILDEKNNVIQAQKLLEMLK